MKCLSTSCFGRIDAESGNGWFVDTMATIDQSLIEKLLL
jgi:hypothetical protein